MLTSATKIVDASFYYLIASRVFAREGGDVLVACSRQEKDDQWITFFGDSYHGDVLQFAK